MKVLRFCSRSKIVRTGSPNNVGIDWDSRRLALNTIGVEPTPLFPAHFWVLSSRPLNPGASAPPPCPRPLSRQRRRLALPLAVVLQWLELGSEPSSSILDQGLPPPGRSWCGRGSQMLPRWQGWEVSDISFYYFILYFFYYLWWCGRSYVNCARMCVQTHVCIKYDLNPMMRIQQLHTTPLQ